MTSEFLKSRLNEDFIIDILFNLGCHSIKKQMFKGKPIICAGNPDGDNKGSINVYLDNFFVSNWTRPIFESRPFKDIITLVEFLENISYSQAIKRICEICGFDYYEREPETPAFLKWVNFVETGKQAKKKNDEIFRPLPERILNQFRLNPVKKWYDEGIKNTIQKDFQIGFDIDTERIIIPIRDELGTLVGVKGRLLRDSEGINDKYIYLYSCPKTQVLFGLYSNYKDIKKAGEVIICEGEKGVLKLKSLGYNNAVGIGSKSISKAQIDKLIRLNVNITIALDKDVNQDEINLIVNELKYPVSLVDIYVIDDIMNLLSNKESPMDDDENWDVLYNNFKFKVA